MSVRQSRVSWAPPFLVGASAAVVTEVATSLLLYTGQGFIRSLTVILAVAGFALALGLWSAPTRLDGIARRWLMSLFAFLTAALYGAGWSLLEAVGDTRWSQAAGLVLLVGFPVFAAGAVLGGLAALAAHADRGLPELGVAGARRASVPGGDGAPAGRPEDVVASGRARVGAFAAAGAALGVVLTGLLLPRTPLPASVLLACLVMLSLGGVLFGVASGSHTEVELRDERPSPLGPLRVEERTRDAIGLSVRVLTEDGHVRRVQPARGEGPLPWDVATARALMPGPETPWSVLVVGGGASAVPRAVLREHPLAEVLVLERSEEVVELGARHFGTEMTVGVAPRLTVRTGHVEDLVKELARRFDVVLVDARVLGPVGGDSGLSREARGRLVQAVGPDGVLVWGPSPPGSRVRSLIDSWPQALLRPGASASEGPARPGRSRRRRSSGPVPRFVEGVLVLSRRDGDRLRALSVEGLVAANGSEPAP